ncbi:MAG: endolytic transglycosylase MltG [Bacteroidia bacterium]
MLKRIFILIFLLALLAGGTGAWFIYHYAFQPNVQVEGSPFLYVPTGATYQEVLDSLQHNNFLLNAKTFDRVAQQKKYPSAIKSGRFRLREGMGNNELINHLRLSGNQEPVDLVIYNVRTKEDLAEIAGQALETDSLQIIRLLQNDTLLEAKYGFDAEKIMVMFLPNTYQFFWNTSAQEFLDRMAVEFKRFWTAERMQKAKEADLSQSEVYILASIVQQETNRKEDMPKIAGVYLNRLRIGMPLQADPTLKWALQNFDAKRVLNKDKLVDSRYNTYKYAGLPPGPICLANPVTIDAVLNHEDHDYLYFVARDDFSGYSVFSKTYSQHLINARKYQRELNRRRIMR